MTTLAALATELATRSDAELLRLLTLRPDAITPPVSSFSDLASRLSSARSINLALDTLTLPQLQLLHALGHAQPLYAPPDALDALQELALVVPRTSLTSDAGAQLWLPLTTVVAALGTVPCRTPSERPETGEDPVIDFRPPPLEGLPVKSSVRDNAAASAIESLLRIITQMLHEVGTAPVAAVHGGAATVRSLRDLSKRLAVNDAQLSFYLELAAMAGLLSLHSASRQWVATPGTWASCGRSQQWLALARAWLGSDRLSGRLSAPLITDHSAAQEGEAGGSAGNAIAFRPLSSDARHPGLATLRNGTLSALAASADTNTSQCPSSDPSVGAGARASVLAKAPRLDSLVQLLDWSHPRQADTARQLAPGILADMELLGLTGAGAPSRAALALASTGGDVLAELAAILPAPLENFLLQGDLTAIAPGYLAPDVAAGLLALAVAEGNGAAGIFRFSEASLRGAAAAGWSESSILAFLRHHSSTSVPQSLEYLIREAAGSVGRSATVGGAQQTTIPAGADAAPWMDGSLPIDDSPPTKDAHPPEPRAGVERAAAQQQLELLRRSTAAAQGDEFTMAQSMEQLRLAIENGSHVSLRAVNSSGHIERLLIRPTSFMGGLLHARVATSGDKRQFSAHRIVGVEPAGSEGTA